MTTSPNLQLPYLAAAQAQKHVTHNEALRTLDVLIQTSAKTRLLATPPENPDDGAVYIVAANASGDWLQQEGTLAAWQDGAWHFITPRPGWYVYVEDEALLYHYDGSAFLPTPTGIAFTNGGDGEVSFFRYDISRVQNPRSYIISATSSDIITLSTNGDSEGIFNQTMMYDVCYVRVWNTTKNPIQSAWVKAVPDWATSKTQLQVTDASHITGWVNGDNLQIGDPTTETPGRVIAIDISRMLERQFGKSFRQKAIYAKATVNGDNGGGALTVTATGLQGSFLPLTVSQIDNVSASNTSLFGCQTPSPISNSNLVFIREAAAGNLAITLASAIGVII